MTTYIGFPVETNPTVLLQRVYDYLEAVIPGWTPAEGNLDVWLAEAFSTEVAELTDVASSVPDTIFRYFGSSLMGVTPIDATAATGITTWTMRDTAGYAIPAGTQVGIRDTSGVLVPFITTNDDVVLGGSSVLTDVGIVAVNPGADGSGLGGAVELIDILDYVTGVTLQGITTGGVDAETDGEYLNRLVAQLQLLSRTPILPADFAALALNIAPAFRAVAIDGYNAFHNLLTANQASIETDASGWAVGTNVNLSRSTAQAVDGVASLAMSSGGAGTMRAITNPTTTVTVTPGDFITVRAAFRAATVARACNVQVYFYDSGLGLTGFSYTGNDVNDTTTGWTVASLQNAYVPAGSAYAQVRVEVKSTAAGAEVHYVDAVSIRRGGGTDFVAGGTLETNNPRMVTVAAVDNQGEPVATGTKNEIKAYLEALREVNFVVNVADPTYATISVTTQIHVLSGFTAASVATAVQSAISTYLNPSNWGQPVSGSDRSGSEHEWINQTTVRKFELAQVINSVDGVDYIITLTLAVQGFTLSEQDVYIGPVAPLTRAGTITVTTA